MAITSDKVDRKNMPEIGKTEDELKQMKEDLKAKKEATQKETPKVVVADTPSDNPLSNLPENVRLQGTDNVVLLKMIRANYSWTTASGIIFTQEHPFQLVKKDEAEELKKDGFVEVDPEEVKAYYS